MFLVSLFSQCSEMFSLLQAENFQRSGVYQRSIFKIRPNILIGLQKLRLRPKDQTEANYLSIHIFLRLFSFVLPYKRKTFWGDLSQGFFPVLNQVYWMLVIWLMSVYLSFVCFSVCLYKVSVYLWFSIMVSERIIG